MKQKYEMSDYITTANEIKHIFQIVGGNTVPTVAVILGSGLGKLADSITDAIVLPYRSIPNFPVSTAPGHKGNLIYGRLNGKVILAMQGRFHYYEGYTMEEITFPVRIFSLLGVKNMIVTNAAGGVNLSYNPGDLMIIKDHICMSPNPLIGKNLDSFGPRFSDMSHPYNETLRTKAKHAAKKHAIDVKEGVYINLTGPSYETVSEVNFFRTIGADAVGMSTVPEVIVARHCGMNVFGMSIITNKATSYESEEIYDEQSVIEEADKASKKVTTIIKDLVALI